MWRKELWGNVLGVTIRGMRIVRSVGISIFLLFASPLPAHAEISSLVWGGAPDGPAQVTMVDDGIYAVPLNTAAPAFVTGPDINPDGEPVFALVGNLYQVTDSGREYLTTVYEHAFDDPEDPEDGDVRFAWLAEGSYELEIIEVAEPAPMFILDNGFARWIAEALFADIAHAQVEGRALDTIRFTIEDAAAACAGECFSNIFFIPGFQASRLYQGTVVSEDQRWEPGTFSLQSDAEALYLDANGQSVNSIYTKADAAIDQVGVPFYSLDIYQTFLKKLSDLAASDAISDFHVFPYDWRMSVEEVVENGAMYNDGIHYPAAELKELAEDSKTEKVTIVAHSNGGLLAKALMRKLESEGKAGLVDKIIFVGTPQLGTPKAVASILHGDFQSIPGWAGFMLSKANARALGENMPGAFGLLPSAEYFARVADPIVDLSAAPALRAGAGLIESIVDSAAELASFLTGAGGRAKPTRENIEMPGVLSPSLLADATALHGELDAWAPPQSVEVIQIAGWGLDTPKGVTYVEKREAFCGLIGCLFATTTRHKVEMTEDGDGTVVSASAAATSTWGTYYINLNQYKTDTGHDVKHAHLTEAQPFQDLLMLLISTTTLSALPAHISIVQPPPIISEKRLRLHVLSPVSLDAYDSFGNHTGMVPNPVPGSDLLYKEELIPNSYYEEFGEGKYLGLPGDTTYTINLKGLALGTFTFEVTPVIGGVEGPTTSFANIPVSASTTATLAIDASGSLGPLVLDQNGDGATDATISSSAQGVSPQAYVRIIISSIKGMDMGLTTRVQLIAKFTSVAYIVPTAKVSGKLKSLVIKMLNEIESYIGQQLKKSAQKPKQGKIQLERITPAQAEVLLDMISELKILLQ